MIDLYNDTGRLNATGIEFDRAIGNALSPIVHGAKIDDINLRELLAVAVQAVEELILMAILDY